MTKQEETIIQKVAEKPSLPRGFVGAVADEVAKIVLERLPKFPQRRKNIPNKKKSHDAEHGVFLDTSAIIDGRIFDVIETGLLYGSLVIPDFILNELKHIADSQDMVKRGRGQRGLKRLEEIKKKRLLKFLMLSEDEDTRKKLTEVDDRLISIAKKYKGRVITCDYNLEKKAAISSVVAVNLHELANRLKVLAVPGESLHITLQHIGKDPTQGVGYLEDGTMVVVERSSQYVGKEVDVVVNRVIQTSSGRILFAKKL